MKITIVVGENNTRYKEFTSEQSFLDFLNQVLKGYLNDDDELELSVLSNKKTAPRAFLDVVAHTEDEQLHYNYVMEDLTSVILYELGDVF